MDVNKESHFFETASIFEENWIERNTVNALRNHATGVGMGVLVQMDERVITFRPKTANCTEYTEDDKSATLTLGYHYGGGAMQH